MILSRFAWYRRARGGYWAQVTGVFSRVRWVRCPEMQPTPDHKWEFYPSAVREASPVTRYVDEWHSVEPCWAVPFSRFVADTIGTNDMACVLGLIKEARNALLTDGIYQGQRSEVMENLRKALIPFQDAKP